MAFVLRRIGFMVAAFCLSSWPVFQLMAMSYITTAMMIYLMWYKPFEDNFFNYIEVMNEITAILLLYVMFSFTDWIPDAGNRYDYAWFFIGITSLNLLVHIFFLMKENIKLVQLKYRKWMNKRKSKHSKKNRRLSKAGT